MGICWIAESCVRCFGLSLSRLDIRRKTCHTDAIAEITRYIGLGDYSQWTENDKQAFLIRELSSRRPYYRATGSPQKRPKKCWKPVA